MHITMKKAVLQKAIGIVGRAISNRSTVPVSTCIMLETQPNGLVSMSGWSIDKAITCHVVSVNHKSGKIALPARLFGELVGAINNDYVEIETNDTTLSADLRAQGQHLRIKGRDGDDFPLIRTVADIFEGAAGKYSAKVVTSDFNTAIGRTAIAAAADEKMFQFCNINFIADRQLIKMQATNSFHLSLVAVKVESISDPITVAINAAVLAEGAMIASALKAETTQIDTTTDHTILSWEGGTEISAVRLYTQPYSGRYPNVLAIIPTMHTVNCLVDAQHLISAVKSAMLFAKEHTGVIIVDVNRTDLTVSATGKESGEAETTIPASVNGEPLQIKLNGAYLQDFLNTIKSGNITIRLSTQFRPALICVEGDEFCQYIIMPMAPKEAEVEAVAA